jgi:uncharacterized protein (TIGR02757 family)
MISLMENNPYEFVMHAGKKEFNRFEGFVHRTFNAKDCITFLKGLQRIYSDYESMENIIAEGMVRNGSVRDGLTSLKKAFFSVPHEQHAEKHFADVMSGAAGKRLFMFLRWMVRSDSHGVDFGIWKSIRPSQLYIPLDVHTGNTARKLGILTRKQNDWKAVEELTELLRHFDHDDPVKYDFALFGLGVSEGF